MIKIKEFDDQTEATMALDFLKGQGFQVEMRGVRDYTSILMGGARGRYSIFVIENQKSQAQEMLLSTSENRPEVSTKKEHLSNPSYYFRRSIIFAVIACIMFPVIANIISIRDAYTYIKMQPGKNTNTVYVFLISAMQIPGFIVGWMLIKSYIG